MPNTFTAGDRVRFAGDYLRRIAEHGTVVVRWDESPTLPSTGRPSDLERAEAAR
jgi:hypothetical protein